MPRSHLEQFQDVILTALPQAESVLLPGVLSRYLPPQVIAAAIGALQSNLPKADIILAASFDDPALIFELSLRLGIPFVTAQMIDVILSDDTDSSGFVQNDQLLQVQAAEQTIAIAKGAIPEKARVLVFRDVLDEGIITLSLLHLTQYSGATAVGVAALIEKGYLGGRNRIAMAVPGIETQALVVLARAEGQVILEKRQLQLLDLHIHKGKMGAY
jgi:adenine/guanine phosphoribosyltransferase-like PRPP-binding protein